MPNEIEYAGEYDMPADVAGFPLEPGEVILWWRRTDSPAGWEIRVRTATGFEGMHDTYDGIDPRA